MSRLIDLTGMKFGRLTALHTVVVNGHIKWHCVCECGNEVDVYSYNLRSGKTQSCGCYMVDSAREKHITHGMAGTKLYNIWAGMKQRCYYEKHISYQFYGAFGIGVCDEWRNDFMSFYRWAIDNGYKEGLSIDRIDSSKDYSPDNCRWADAYSQACNRKSNLLYEYNGKTQILKRWAEEFGVDYHALYHQIKRGLSLEEAVEEVSHKAQNTQDQFISPYSLDDNDIEELIEPTVNEIHDVLSGDWRKTILFLNGSQLNERNVDHVDNDIAKAIMIDHNVLNDPYVKSTVYQLIRNRIDEAKVGVIKVHGNYSIASGDPYALCQSMFGLEVTGLLKAGEIYNQYWRDVGAERLACFRAPMTSMANIRSVHPVNREDANRWYQYMKTCTIFNAWDTSMMALNGMDKHHCPIYR